MARDAKKKAAEPQQEKTLEQLILDRSEGKYALVPLASAWALTLRRKEEFRHLTQNEILDLALRQLLSDEVTPEQVKAQAAHDASEAAQANGLDAKEKKKL